MTLGMPLRAAVANTELTMGRGVQAQVAVPEAVLRGADGGEEISAQISVQLPPNARGARLHVLVNPPADALSIPPNSPHFAGSIQIFGSPHHGPSTFVVP